MTGVENEIDILIADVQALLREPVRRGTVAQGNEKSVEKLHDAALSGDRGTLRQLIFDEHVNPFARDSEGRTAFEKVLTAKRQKESDGDRRGARELQVVADMLDRSRRTSRRRQLIGI